MTTDDFLKLYSINVNDKVEEKNGLSYLSWSYAWAEFKKVYPEATYAIKFFGYQPYVYDEKLGYMVFTSVTVNGLTHDMWLPVMDGANKAMKATDYKYKTKYGDKTCEAATMFDINKAIMRCLVKNLAMFGLGLYIYSGEDLPEAQTEEKVKPTFGYKELENLKAKKDQYTFEAALKEVREHYTVSTDMEGKIMELYGTTAGDLF